MGIGFGYDHLYHDEYNHEHSHMFIRGNHDNPAKCRELHSYLGDYGYLEDEGIFYISGACSIDKQLRTEGLDWWHDEQLSDSQFTEAIALFEETKPEIVVSHNCPWGCHPHHSTTTKTARALDIMFSEHQPTFWFFGHHHKPTYKLLNGTTFIGLGINEVIHLSDLEKGEGDECATPADG